MGALSGRTSSPGEYPGRKHGSCAEQDPAFADLTARERRGVAAIVHKREYKAGEPVFYQGDPGWGMYIIREGEVSIRISEGDGEDKELAVLTDGDCSGELALLDESPRSATAICRTD
jgi:CRP-like cAMP-binding protein